MMGEHLAFDERLGMDEDHQVVIREAEDGRFWGGAGWVEEYPDAVLFTAPADDEDAMSDVEDRAIEKAGEVVTQYPGADIEVVAGYGYAFEEVLCRYRRHRRDRAA